jgi:hypothetical protein
MIIRPASVLASEEGQNKDEDHVEARARMFLQLATVSLFVNWFLIATQSRIFGIDLRRDMPQSVASRADVSKVPLLGGLFQPTLGAQFAAAQNFGPVYLLNKSLVLLPQILLASFALSVVLTHRNRVYRPPGRLRSLKLAQPLNIPDLTGRRPVGRAAIMDRTLLVMVTPSIMDNKDFREE